MTTYREFYRRSIEDKEGFWAEQAKLVHWQRPPGKVLDYRRPPFARWFVGGETNLCYNALDRHLGARGDQKALVYISTETGEERSFSYRELHLEVQRAAAEKRAHLRRYEHGGDRQQREHEDQFDQREASAAGDSAEGGARGGGRRITLP